MIYLGILHFNDVTAEMHHKLKHALAPYTKEPPNVMIKEGLIFCHGKLPNLHDVEQIWENEDSLMVGRVFDKEKFCNLSTVDFNKLSHCPKEDVLKKIWGNYIYINLNKKSEFDVAIDLTGQLPFFYYVFSNGNILFSSDIEIISRFIAQKFTINSSYLSSYLLCGPSSSIQTPFKEIYELPPGCCLTITPNERKTKAFWNPLSYIESSKFEGLDAVGVLQSVLKLWIAPYKNIYVSLSGGLDSSSLVYCLKSIKKEGQKLTAVNYFHGGIQTSNELVHAQKVCNETGINLIAIDIADSLPFDPPLTNQPLRPNKPSPESISLKNLEAIYNHIPSASSIIISGHGSDHIFMCPPSKKSVSDYILEKGLKGCKEHLKNITQFYRDPLYPVVKENIGGLFSYFSSQFVRKKIVKKIQDKMPSWISKEVKKQLSSDFIHPIYAGLSTGVLPGKYDQINGFYEGINSVYVKQDHSRPEYYPFFAEPVVEFALSLSTYDLLSEGYDRYPLRQAVSKHFKTKTVWRRDKSQTTGLLQLGVKKNLEAVLELCLEGYSVNQGLVDKESLHKNILLIANGDSEYLWPFIHIASLELFLKKWEKKTFEDK